MFNEIKLRTLLQQLHDFDEETENRMMERGWLLSKIEAAQKEPVTIMPYDEEADAEELVKFRQQIKEINEQIRQQHDDEVW